MTPTEALEPQQEQEQPDRQQDYEYGERNRELPQQLVDLVAGVIKKYQKQDNYLRRREVMRDRKARFYERGYQHLAWTGTGTMGGFSLISPGLQVAGSATQAPQYIDDYNIFWPYERIQLSILTQNPPGIDFQPNDPNAEEDIEAAKTAEKYTKIFDRNNDIKSLQTSGLRNMLLGARSISWTRTTQDGQKYGYNPDGSEKSVEITTFYGTLESRVSIMAKCQRETPFIFLYDDPQVDAARFKYDWIKDKIQGNQAGLGENQYERLARLGALQGSRQPMATGESFSYLTTRMYCWLRPEAFGGKEFDAPFEDGGETEDGQPMTCRDKLLEMYSDGACFTFIGEVYAESYAESMDDRLDIAFPFEGDGMYRMAPMDSMVVNQDAFNDAMNATRQIFDVGWPSRWIGTDQAEFDSIVGQVASPYAFRLKKIPPGGKLEDVLHEENSPETPQTFEMYKEFVQGALPQFQTATPPALWGAQMPDQKTAHGYAQAQQSAMGQLGIIWGAMQGQWARIRYQSALCASTNPDYAELIVVPEGDGGKSGLSLQAITKGKFRCFPDEDSSFPETTAAQRAQLTQVLELLVQAQSPLGIQIMNDPDNVEWFLQKYGLASEINVPEAEARNAQQLEIEELIQQAPVVSPMAIQTAMQGHADAAISGAPVQPFDPAMAQPDQPSVPINDYDYHQWHAAKCQSWLNGEDCRKQQAKGNTKGVQNVILHWKAHVAALAAMMPPPMPQVAAPKAPPKPAGGPPPGAPPAMGPPQLTM